MKGGDDTWPRRLSRRLSGFGSRRHSRNPTHQQDRSPTPPNRPAEYDFIANRALPPVCDPVPRPVPVPDPAQADPPMRSSLEHPDKTEKSPRSHQPPPTVLSSTEHGTCVLQGIDSFRTRETFCDVTLVPGDSEETFPVHRVVMASCSDYFKAMFTGDMREKHMRVIKLHGVTKLGLKKLIEFIYTSKVSIDIANLQEVLEAANFLQVMPVLSFCNQLLMSEISIDNCVEVDRITTELLLGDMQKINIGEFVTQNLSLLVQDGHYLQLSETTIANSLASNSLKGLSEMELFHIAKKWLEHNPAKCSSVYALMRNIRFPLMSPSELIQISQNDEGSSLMTAETDSLNLLLEASNYQMMPFMQPVMQTERTQIRSDATHILALGGVMRQQLVVSRELRAYDDKKGHWTALRPMPVPCYQHGVAILNGFLFIVGGQTAYDTKGKMATDSAYRYDPRFNVWLQIASLNQKRTFFHASAVNGTLFAIGGRNTTGEIDTVECYNPRKNEWTFVAKMAEPHYGHAGTIYKERIYISGGITHDVFHRELWCYDPLSDTWSQKADMTELRGLHCMCTVGDRLFVTGGNNFQGSNSYGDVLSCESYSPETDQWTMLAPMPQGQSDVGSAVFNGKIYVVGGYSWDQRCMVNIVQRYDPEQDAWDKVTCVFEPLGGIRACTMTVHMPEQAVDDAPIQEISQPTFKS